MTYAEYYDNKKKQWFIGYKAGINTYKPLNKPGTEATADISLNAKYLLVTSYQLDSKKKRKNYTTIIFDAPTGKVIREIPQYHRKYLDHDYRWEYGDELVRVYFLIEHGKDTSIYLQAYSPEVTIEKEKEMTQVCM